MRLTGSAPYLKLRKLCSDFHTRVALPVYNRTYAPVIERISRLKWGKLILTMLVACIINCLFIGIIGSSDFFSVELAEISGFNYILLSQMFLIAFSAALISAPFFGYLAVRKSCFFVIRLGLALTIAALILLGIFIESLVLVWFVGLLWGIGGGAVSYGVVYGAAAEHVPRKLYPVLSTMMLASHNIVAIILIPIFFPLIENLGLDIASTVLAAAVLLLAPFSTVLKDSRVYHEETLAPIAGTFAGVFKHILKSGFFWVFAAVFVVLGFLFSQVINDAEVFLYYFDFDELLIPFLILLNIALILGSFIFRRFLERHQYKFDLLILGIAVLLVFIPIWIAVPTSIALIVEYCIVCLFLLAAYPLIISILMDHYKPLEIIIALSLLVLIYHFSISLDTVLDAVVYFIVGNVTVHMFLVIGAVIAALVFLLLYQRRKVKAGEMVSRNPLWKR